MILLDPTATVVIGHRGASGEFPENTLLAFERAVEQGADALEFDVRLARDGAVVVIHDATLDRTTNGAGPVRDRTLPELRALDAGGGQRVPTLEEVLERFPDTPLILELKESAVADAARRCLDRHRAAKRVLVGSFEPGALRPFGKPTSHRAASRRETALAWGMSRVGLPLPGSFEAFTVPERHGRLRLVDRRFVAAARRAGRPVHAWTVNDVQQARRLRLAGVCGIITNYPDRMRNLGA
ncbi:MAG: glycerophosphodiester phosphodiesterase [Gemmatimonadales bacterium]|nr:glycerophosphodiester phosphodiesterase [Gemmatimonadales bacterium]